MAQLTTRKRGKTWEYRFEMASVNGKRKQKSKGGFRTKADALKAGTEALNEYNSIGIVRVNSEMSVADFFTDWQKTVDLKETSLALNDLIIRKHIIPELGKYKMGAVTHSTLQRFINKKSEIYSYNYMQNMRRVLNSAFKYAYEKLEIIKRNPSVNLSIPRTAAKKVCEVRAYTIDECLQFMEMAKSYRPAYIVLYIAFFTGMRTGEIMGLQWEDIDYEQSVIHIRHNAVYVSSTEGNYNVLTVPKTESSCGDVPIGDNLKRFLKEVEIEQKENMLRYGQYYYRNYTDDNGTLYATNERKDGEHNLVIRQENGKFVNRSCLYRNLRERLPKGFRIHNFRHTQATILLQEGVPIKEVQSRLRHASVRTTLDIYAEATQKTHEMSIDVMEKAWTNGGQTEKKAK